MSARRLNPERGEHEAMCQQGRWTSKGCKLGGPTSIEERTSVSENTGPQREVDCEIPH